VVAIAPAVAATAVVVAVVAAATKPCKLRKRHQCRCKISDPA
jgi:hypothetical protein